MVEIQTLEMRLINNLTENVMSIIQSIVKDLAMRPYKYKQILDVDANLNQRTTPCNTPLQ